MRPQSMHSTCQVPLGTSLNCSYITLHAPDLQYQYDIQKCNVSYIILHVPVSLHINTARVQLVWDLLCFTKLYAGSMVPMVSVAGNTGN